jgi:hypothetical protein
MLRDPSSRACFGTQRSCLTALILMPFVVVCKSDSGSVSAHHSTPQLNVRVYAFSGLSLWLVQTAEAEAASMLHSVPVQLKWIDSSAKAVPPACLSPQLPTDLIVRFLAKALPNASTSALGITDSIDACAAAFVFFDRVQAFRTHTRLLPTMLARVMAHEISHLLLPKQGHSDLGLMRGQWAVEDLEIASSRYLGLPAKSLKLMQKEALRKCQASESAGGYPERR